MIDIPASLPALVETPPRPASAPLINNLHMPHTWSAPDDDKPVSCLRCGVHYPSQDSCP